MLPVASRPDACSGERESGSSAGGLYIGAGTNLEPGSFFSGLIDDIRIYNRAIAP
jgi:hypothetical protein